MALGTAGANDISFYKGEDVTIRWEVEATLASDITGWTLVMTLKDTDNAPTVTVTINGTVTDGPNRLFSTVISAAVSAAITVGAYKMDVWRTDAGYAWLLNDGNATCRTERRVQTP